MHVAGRRSFILLLAALATVGPFSIDTFLPSLPALQTALGATLLQSQQALTAYMLGFAVMSLWHGAISDAVGRRPVLLYALAIYAIAALACTVAPSIEVLLAARLVQGLFGGAGMIVSRAIIRDCYEGPAAQRMMSTVMLIFSIAPAVGPILGGYLHEWFGWRSVFGFMLAGSVLLWVWTYRALPETLAPAQRAPLHAGTLARGYWQIFTRREFQWLAAVIAFNFATFFVYVSASPIFIIEHLGLTATDFGVYFVPVIVGMMLGAALSGRLAGRLSYRRTVFAGYLVLGTGIGLNLALQALVAPALPPGSMRTFVSIAPLVVASAGQAMIAPSVQLMLMDLFPQRRGMMASCQGFTQLMVSTVVAGVIAPWVSDTALHLAIACAGFFVVGLTFWMVYHRATRRSR